MDGCPDHDIISYFPVRISAVIVTELILIFIGFLVFNGLILTLFLAGLRKWSHRDLWIGDTEDEEVFAVSQRVEVQSSNQRVAWALSGALSVIAVPTQSSVSD